MAKPIALILVSHGDYARAALSSAEMIVGPQENCGTVSLTREKGMDDLYREIQELIKGLDTDRGIILMADLLGGTPGNIAARLVLERSDVHAYAGFSLPVLIECLSGREGEIPALDGAMEACGKTAFQSLTKKLRGETAYGNRISEDRRPPDPRTGGDDLDQRL